MPADHISRILAALNASRVRYVVVGGVAVVLHGHLRFTADLDLVLALDRENILLALGALKILGFQPRPPVRPEDFAEPDERARCVREKGMAVFSLWSPTLPGTDVDLFAEEPIPFSALASRARLLPLGDTSVPVASIPDLIALKRKAGRATDIEDIAALERIELSLKGEPESSEPVTGWAKHAEERRDAWLRLTPAQRLAWLEQAKEFAALVRSAHETSRRASLPDHSRSAH